MGITDELRAVAAETEGANGRCGKLYRCDLERIADRIDIAHKHAIGYVDDRDPETMAENGWVRLPKDADGEYIRIGDKVTLYDRCVYEVDAIYLHKDRVSVSYSGESGCGCDSADNFHHYHEPTVEDLLCEFATDWECAQDGEDKTAVLKEYAAKFRLADDGEGQ